jgi:transcriptional regulator with XRE-family HTH domain
MSKNRAPDLDKLIGQRVKAARLLRSMSQTALAEALGISFQQVQKYEKGMNRIAASTLVDIRKILDTSFDYLLGAAPTKTAADLFVKDRASVELLESFAVISNRQFRNAILTVVSYYRKLEEAEGRAGSRSFSAKPRRGV